MNETDYLAGQRAVYLEQLRAAIRGLRGIADGADLQMAVDALRVEELRAAILTLCRDFDIDAPSDLYPVDIIEKYIRPRLA